MEANGNLQSRDGFKSRWGFILACIGSAVGMGNIWRLPILVSTWGGLTFLVPFFLFMILIGASGAIGEMALGRMAGAGPIGAFGYCTQQRTGNVKLGRRMGVMPVICSMALAIGYTCVMGWVFKYTFLSFSGGMFAMGDDLALIENAFNASAKAWGSNLWVVVAIVICFAIMAMGIAGGIEKACKVMMPLLFFLFVALGVYIAFLPNAAEGYRYIFTFDVKALKNPMLWIYAFGQAFFSMSVSGCGTVIYGSYLSREENIPFAAFNVTFFNMLSAMLSIFMIIPAMAVSGTNLSVGGPGLLFIYLVKILNGIPAGRFIGILFFVAVMFAGVSSIINLYEAPIATVQEEFHLKRIPATAITLVIGGAVALCIQGIVSEWMDFVSIYLAPLGALLAGIAFFWIAGKKLVLQNVNEGAKKPIGRWFFPLGKYVYCICALVALVAGIIFGGIG